jgi:ParB/RepB/Spo0J family partition protein
MNQELIIIKRANVVRSTTNPRTIFDPAKLAELAATIKATGGVHTPLLLRPLPGWRVPDVPRNVTHEIVCGERRDRGCEIAGVDEYPALVKDLSDGQVRQIQMIENLQRVDLTALEEAEGYHELIEKNGMQPAQIAAETGKSRTTIFSRLKLLDMCHEARAALRDGAMDTSRAELVARIPDQKLQLKALKELTAKQPGTDDYRLSYRQARVWVAQNVMLRLEHATFSIKDATLCADTPACTDCALRTGANPELFADVDSPDVCTNPPCFHAKEAAALDRELADRRSKGVDTVPEEDIDAHTRLDAPVALPGGAKPTVAELMNDFMTNAERKKAVKAGVVGGQVVNLVPTEVVADLQARARDKAVEKAPASKGSKATAEPAAPSRTATERAEASRKQQLEDQYEAAWRGQVAQALKPLLLAGAVVQFDATLLRKMLEVILQGMDWAVCRAALDLPNTADQATERATVDALPDTELGPRICMALALEEADELRHGDQHGRALTTPTILQHLAATCGVDVAAIQATVQQDMRAQLAPAATKNPGAPGVTPPKGGGGKTPKLTAAQAQQGIADAMQGIEAAASCGAAEAPAQPASVDPLLAQAIALITREQKASVRLLKEELGIGTGKAMGIMDQLEDAGKVGPATERGARKVLVTA